MTEATSKLVRSDNNGCSEADWPSTTTPPTPVSLGQAGGDEKEIVVGKYPTATSKRGIFAANRADSFKMVFILVCCLCGLFVFLMFFLVFCFLVVVFLLVFLVGFFFVRLFLTSHFIRLRRPCKVITEAGCNGLTPHPRINPTQSLSTHLLSH